MNSPFSRLRQACAYSFTRPLTLVLLVGLLASACKDDDDDATPEAPGLIAPKGAKPTYGPNMDNQMWAVIEKFTDLDPLPLPSSTPQQARMNPSVTDAVEHLLAENNRAAPAAAVAVSQVRIMPPSVPGGLLVRTYTPTAAGAGPFPVIVYYHGGGWVIGSLDVYEPSCKALAEKTGAVVVSVDYRLAPEYKFPTAHTDAFAAYKYVVQNAASFNGNPLKVAVAGESAGGNMACTVSMMARDSGGVALPKHQLLVYPVANNDTTTASYVQYAMAKPLDRASVGWFTRKYFRTPADGNSPLISLTDVAVLTGLPSTTIIGAEIDPLMTEGQTLRDKLTMAGVSVTYELYGGTTHEFFGTHAVVPKATQAQDLAASKLKAAFQ